MTVLLVLFTLILFLVFDHVVQKQKTRTVPQTGTSGSTALPVQLEAIYIPEDVSCATNHTWMRKNDDGTVTVGVDNFLNHLVGGIDLVALPGKGEAPACMVGAQGRTLRLDSPVTGSVLESNADLCKNPALMTSDPYGKGWLMKLKVSAEDTTRAGQFLVRQPSEWLREQVALVRDFIVMNSNQGQPVLLQEGGLPVEGVLQQFDDGVWQDFGRSFASLHPVRQSECQEIRP